jgi:prolipoprotein diacylglyceryl transferase
VNPVLTHVLASLPSPDSNEIVLGPLHLRAYGLMIAIGVIAAVELARRRWKARGHDPDQISGMALWAVPAGLIGSRVYHVITDWHRFHPPEGQFVDAFKIWEGGLGIPGGIAFGAAAGLLYAKKKGMPLAEFADSTVPAIPLAQAIGRLGNWFNQELFGRPTDLPWGLEIDVSQRPDGYLDFTTFHPTFLYEALWNLALVGVLILIDRKKVLRPGKLVWVYLGGYFLGRLWVEALRIDPATEILGLRVNLWVSIVVVVVSAVVLILTGRRRPEDDVADVEEPEPEEPEAVP